MSDKVLTVLTFVIASFDHFSAAARNQVKHRHTHQRLAAMPKK